MTTAQARGGALPASADGIRPREAHAHRVRPPPRVLASCVRAPTDGPSLAEPGQLHRPRGRCGRCGRSHPRGPSGFDAARGRRPRAARRAQVGSGAARRPAREGPRLPSRLWCWAARGCTSRRVRASRRRASVAPCCLASTRTQDEEREYRSRVLDFDELGIDGAQLDVHRSSVLESADCIPPYSCWSSEAKALASFASTLVPCSAATKPTASSRKRTLSAARGGATRPPWPPAQAGPGRTPY
jgi:hypothetical protein